MSGQLINELFPDCTRSCFLQVVLRRRGGDRIYEMRCLFVAVGHFVERGLKKVLVYFIGEIGYF